MIKKPVSAVQSTENMLSIVDINGTTIAIIYANENTDILTEEDFVNAQEIIKAINILNKN